jgi:hypothetical protein
MKLTIPAMLTRLPGRLRAIGYGAAGISESLNQVIWSYGLNRPPAKAPTGGGAGAPLAPPPALPLQPEPRDAYCFAADFYAYLVLTLWATAYRSGKTPAPEVDFFRFFYLSKNGQQDDDLQSHEATGLLNAAVLGGNMLRFAFADDLSKGNPLSAVYVGDGKLEPRDQREATPPAVTDVGWFNRARTAAGLP